MADLTELQTALGVSFKDLSNLEQALVHSSYINENPGLGYLSNERLEFLGDAVLGLVIAEKLFKDFPDFTEGEMSRVRASLVRRDTLARIAGTIKLGSYLYLGKGEDASGGREKPANLAGAFEALISAIFLDRGLVTTRSFILKLIDKEFQTVIRRGGGVDYKSQLQELVQAKLQQAPAYHVIEAAGPDHDRKFTVEVRIGDVVLGKGSGKSKKIAETEAALAALRHGLARFTQ